MVDDCLRMLTDKRVLSVMLCCRFMYCLMRKRLCCLVFNNRDRHMAMAGLMSCKSCLVMDRLSDPVVRWLNSTMHNWSVMC